MASRTTLRYLQEFGRSVRLSGISSAARLGSAKVLRLIAGSPVMRRLISPSVSDVLKSANNVSTSATHALAKFFPETDETLLKQWANEYDDSIAGQFVQSESSEPHSLYPTEWAVAQETAVFLYLLVRLRRPSLVVETGVANGISSTSILLALAKNGHGRLVSIDVDENVG